MVEVKLFRTNCQFETPQRPSSLLADIAVVPYFLQTLHSSALQVMMVRLPKQVYSSSHRGVTEYSMDFTQLSFGIETEWYIVWRPPVN